MLEIDDSQKSKLLPKKPQAKLSTPLSRSTPNLAMGFSSEFISVLCKLSYCGAARQRTGEALRVVIDGLAQRPPR